MQEFDGWKRRNFYELMSKIVKAGATPVMACTCGMKSWMFEGSFDSAYKALNRPCHRCGVSGSKIILGDFEEHEL